MRLQLLELDGSTGERFAPSAYVPFAGTDEAPVYTTTQFTYEVNASDDSVVTGADINATIYDLAGNVNYYSSAESTDSVFNSNFSSVLYSGIDLDGVGAKASIASSTDVDQKVIQLDGPLQEIDFDFDSDTSYGVGSTLYFEITYDQNIYTNNTLGAAEDIRLFLQTDDSSASSLVAATILSDQLDSYSSASEISNRELTFTYVITETDDSNEDGYLLHSLDYTTNTSTARYGILDSYGNGINDVDADLKHDISSLNIRTAPIDTVMPVITAVTIEDEDGVSSITDEFYGKDETITFALSFSKPKYLSPNPPS